MRALSTRRQFLKHTALAGLAATAGCLSNNPGQTVSGDDPDPSSTPTAESTPVESLDAWLEDANGYDGEPIRFGPQDRPSIHVGEKTDDGIGFSPAVIEVPPLSEVTWDWTGHGGQHNVVALDGTFDSGRTNAKPGTSYHYFFEEVGEYPFVSEPDRDSGMKGAVIVAEPPTTGNDAVDEWLANTGNFDGTVTDRTGTDSTTIAVGAEGNGAAFAFSPPALRIRTGTSVVWEWTGNGGGHNVVFEDADIESDDVGPEPGRTFEHTFDTAGTYRYYCDPHHALGMRGAIIVEEKHPLLGLSNAPL